jgi:regulator of sigma E protease
VLTTVAFLVVIGVLIFVHELGHFLVAKAVGIQVLRFSLGFGRPLVSFTRGETEYWISWIPLGGYVKMAGLEDEGMAGELEGGKSAVPLDPARAFDQQPLLARIAVILAGVTMNFLFAFAVYASLFATVGEPRTAITPVDSVDVDRLPPAAAPLATLGRGGLITRINGDTVRTWDDVQDHFLGPRGDLRIEVAGRPAPIELDMAGAPDSVRRNALLTLHPQTVARIGLVNPGQPAARAKLRLGDLIVRVDGDSVRSWEDMVRRVRASPGKALTLDVQRGDSILRVSVTPEAQGTRGVIGAAADPRGIVLRVPVGVGTAIVDAAGETVAQVGAVATMVKRLVRGQASTSEVGGPLAIAQMSGQMVRLGVAYYLTWMAFFSVSLAVLNLLPIPVLDGGHFMFLIAEAIRRKPLSLQLRLRLTQIGMLVVLAIMVLAISNDVLKFFR